MNPSPPNGRNSGVDTQGRADKGAAVQSERVAEEWLRLAEQAARQIIAGEPACTVTVDRQLAIRDVDPAGAAWAELDGNVEQARGRSLLDFVAPEMHEAVRAAAALVFGGQVRHFRATALTARGRRRIVDAWASVISAHPTAEPLSIVSIFDITDLATVEAERDMLASIVRTAPDAVISVSTQGRITSWNPAAERLYGYSAREALGHGFDLYVPAEGLEQVQAGFTRVVETGTTLTYDQRRRRRDGTALEVSVAVFPTCDSAGHITGTAGIARDVTEQRAVERKLEAERQYSRSLVESSLDALLVSDSNLILTDANRQATTLTGYSREELVGIELASIFTDPARARRIAHDALEKGSVHGAELELMTRRAEQVAVSLDAAAYCDAQGAVRGVLVSVSDIAERKRAERERSMLAAIVSSSGDAIYSVTPELTIGTWNAGAERLFGYQAAEVIGASVKLLVPLDLRGELARYLERLREGENLLYETRRLRKDGSIVDVSIVASPIFGADRRLGAIAVIARDVSARKRTEEELTAARDAALEAAQARSRFLANMSHEIRTPLNSIIGMTGLLMETPLSAGQLELARDVRDSGETLLGLVNDILDFSKMAAGELAFEEIDLELTAVVAATVDLVADRARRKGLELTAAVDPDVPRLLRGDPGRLRQALLNLVDNAVKFTERGTVAVQVGKIGESPADAVMRFEVRDTGIGIPRDKLDLLFKPFSQVDASTTRHFGGTGLGLSITRELVERMNGSVGVTSTPGAGSTFWFTARFAKQANAPRMEPLPSLAGRRVLIVDDDPNSRKMLSRQVSTWGMAPVAVGGAVAALDAIRKAAGGEPFDVALIDLVMPETDGIELARSLKRDRALARIPLIVVSSGGPMRDYGERLRGVELSAWLTKPVAASPLFNELAAAIARVDQRRPGRAAASVATPTGRDKVAQALAARKPRILVAEDNPINQKLARLQLSKLAIHTDTVGDGREAVKAVFQVPYDVVLMDCQMPEMDGYEATREIRRREGNGRHTKIVAVTAHALSGDQEKCLAAGMDDYLSKPVKAEALEAVLARVLNLAPPSSADCVQAPLISDDRRTSSDSEEVAMESPKGKAEAPALDRATLEELRAEGDNLLVELLDMFAAEAPAGLARISEAFERGDLKTASLQAHRLKGSAAGLGARRMQDLCGAVEQAARAEQAAEARASFDRLTSECKRVLEAIAAEHRAAR